MNSGRGASLVESLLVVVMLGFIVMLLANLPAALGLIQKSRHLSLAREIASKEIENKRQTNYENLTAGSVNITDLRIYLLPAGSGAVLTENCDPAVCTNSEDIKRITVTVNWKQGNKPQQVVLGTFIGRGGLNQ